MGECQFKTERSAARTAEECLGLTCAPGQRKAHGRGALHGLTSRVAIEDKTANQAAAGVADPGMAHHEDFLESDLYQLLASDHWPAYTPEIDRLLDDANVARRPGAGNGVEARRYVTEGGAELRVFLNYSKSESRTIDVPERAVDLVRRTPCGRSIALAPLDVGLVRIGSRRQGRGD